MNGVIDVGFSALVTKNIVDELKRHGWLNGGFWTVVASFVINFAVCFGLVLMDAIENGQELNVTFVRATASTIVAALYNDARKSMVESAPKYQ